MATTIVKSLLPFFVLALLGPVSCGSEKGEGEDVVSGDLTDSGPTAEDVSDTPPDTEERRYSFRVISGVSMGANAVTVAAHHPTEFDVVGSMGGYVDNRYLSHMMEHFLLGGFCPMEQILANIDHVNEADNPDVFCGPVPTTMPYEHDWSYNHLNYDNSGGEWGREFLMEMMEGFMFAFGNLMYYNPDNPLIPPGVSKEWFLDENDKCKNPAVVGKPHNFHKEYNPQGKYNLITYCEADTVECEDTSMACLDAKGAYEPDKPHDVPVRFMFAVDYNGNGLRDYGEPVIHKGAERYEDTGTDGCGDDLEDGSGGCTGAGDGNVADPNHDNFDLVANPGGTELNFNYDEGEPFEDLGLDGLAEQNTGYKDYGEDNQKFDRNPRIDTMIEADARTFFNTAPLADVRRIHWYFDGGIRDSLHALPLTMNLSNALKLRGLEVREYDDFSDTDNALYPDATCDDLLTYMGDIDFSATGMGRNVLVRYGNPDASDTDIIQGDGKHVGLACQMANRVLVFFSMAAYRLPDPIVVADGDNQGEAVHTSTWSQSLNGRVRYSISLPPGYNAPENADLRYPLMIFLPGHGMGADVMVLTGSLFNMLAAQGIIPRFILLAPEGQCCYVNRDTGVRYCGCTKDVNKCIDPDCKDDHESCAIVDDPGKLEQECNGGHFFYNHTTNRWAEADVADIMRFEDSLMDVIADVDKRFRTRKPEVIEVPYDF